MVLKLYSDPTTYAGGGGAIVALVLAEKQIPFEHVPISLAANEHKTPEFRAMHPFGQAPVINDDGFILYETRAICRYLDEKYPTQGTPLIPVGLKQRALFEQAASVEFANFHPYCYKITMELFGNPAHGVPTDQAALTSAISVLSAKLDVYETILGKQRFLAGDEITLVDLFHLLYAVVFGLGGLDLMTKKGPNLARWWNVLISRPAWVKIQKEGMKSSA
ncbi:glutathione S-transferase [Mycena polygramma]|nr:glutathione S-transferase [Mycena polygramma]